MLPLLFLLLPPLLQFLQGNAKGVLGGSSNVVSDNRSQANSMLMKKAPAYELELGSKFLFLLRLI